MAHTPHELAEEFPDHLDRIHVLKTTNKRFAKLMQDYHEVNRAVHRAETGVEPCEELAEVQMRKERMHLKDQIAAMLAQA